MEAVSAIVRALYRMEPASATGAAIVYQLPVEGALVGRQWAR